MSYLSFAAGLRRRPMTRRDNKQDLIIATTWRLEAAALQMAIWSNNERRKMLDEGRRKQKLNHRLGCRAAHAANYSLCP